MNLAFSTIIFFILLLPGQVFRRYYFTEEFSKEYFKQSLNELFVAVFIPSLVLHGLWILIVPVFFNYYVDLKILGEILLSKDYPAKAFDSIQSTIVPIIFYNLSIFIFAAVSGNLLRFLVRRYKFDIKYKVLRFQNSWHYILMGEFMEFPRASLHLENDSIDDIDIRYVDALVEVDGKAVIYDGILVDYELSKDGSLDYITLSHANRRYLKDDPIQEFDEEGSEDSGKETKVIPEIKAEESEDSRGIEFESISDSNAEDSITSDIDYPDANTPFPYHITGHILLLPYNRIKNLNFTYFKVVENEVGEFNVEEVS